MPNRGTYCDLATLKTAIGVTGTTDDVALLARLEAASRWIDNHCARHFYVVSEARYFTAFRSDYLCVDDLLSITALKTDEDDDRDYDYTWAATDYDLEPFNSFPKWRISVTPQGDYTFPSQAKGVQITGLWGYGDGERAAPYDDSGTTTNEELDASETAVTVASGAALAIGQTILVESEQMYITGISTNDLTVVRGVNGTTAVTHATGKAIYIYRYPSLVKESCLLEASRLWHRKDSPFGVAGSGDFGEQAVVARIDPTVLFNLAPYRLLGAQ